MVVIVGDFETRSEAQIKSTGQDRYAADPTTELLCMSFALDGEEPRLWLPGQPFPPELEAAIKAGAMFHAHNAAFEMAIWREVCVKRLGWPPIPLSQWACSASLAAYRGLPRALADAAAALNIGAQKDKEGHRLMLRVCKPLPKAQQRSRGKKWEDDPKIFERVYRYCQQDVRVEQQIEQACGGSLPPRERRIWLLDQRINYAGVPIDIEACHAAIKCAQWYDERIKAELRKLTDGQVVSYTQLPKMSKWLRDRGLDMPSMDAASVSAALHRTVLPADVRRVLEIRQDAGRSSISKYRAMIARSGEDGRARGVHQYYGAHTGRWAGRGIQFQNVPKGKIRWEEHELLISLLKSADYDAIECIWGSITEVLVSLLRPMVRAPEGKELVVVDFASIEARVLAWCAGQSDLVELFRRGGDPYVAMASKIYGVPVDQVTKSQRSVGKVAVLGLGYGMGSTKFEATCAKFKLQGVDAALSQRVVEVYRTANSKIRQFWYDLEDAARRAIADPSKAYTIRDITFAVTDGVLTMCLPSGRTLWYRDMQLIADDEFDRPRLSYEKRKDVRVDTYGGKLCENAIQAVARDFLAEGMLRLDEQGYPIVMHVHDEVVVEMPQGSGALDEIERILCEVPKWGRGCPIDAAGYVAERYRKD